MMEVNVLFRNELTIKDGLVSHLSGYENFNCHFRLYCWDELNDNYIIAFDDTVEYLRIIEEGRDWIFDDDISNDAIKEEEPFLPFFKILGSQFEKDFHEMNWDVKKTDKEEYRYYHYCFCFNNDTVEFMINAKPRLIKSAYETGMINGCDQLTKRHPLEFMDEEE